MSVNLVLVVGFSLSVKLGVTKSGEFEIVQFFIAFVCSIMDTVAGA
jgi:hypothetical protein